MNANLSLMSHGKTDRAVRQLKQLLGVFITSGLVLLAAGCASKPQRTAGQTIDDQATARRVEEALRSDPSYKFADVKVAAYEGKVQLSGFVEKGDQKGRAEDIAKKVPGVKDVKNDIALQ